MTDKRNDIWNDDDEEDRPKKRSRLRSVLLFFLPERIYFKIMQYERYIMVVFIALIISGIVDLPISYASEAIINLFLKFAFLPFGG